MLRSQRDAVGLHLFSDGLKFQSDARLSAVHEQHLIAELSRLLEHIQSGTQTELLDQKTSAAEVLHELAESLPRRSLVILFTDLLDTAEPEAVFSALQHFRYNQHELILFHVLDEKYEGNFDYPFKPHKFIDLETGEVVRFNPSNIKEHYLSLMKKMRAEINLRCGQYGIDLVEAFIQNDFREVLLPFLIKRKKLY